MLARPRNLGFGVPNRTYPFLKRRSYRANLENMVQDRNELGLHRAITLSTDGILVLGGTHPVTNKGGFRNAVEGGFN